MSKLTIVKIMDDEHPITQQDVERWRKVFDDNGTDLEEAKSSGKIEISEVDTSNDGNYITLVKIGADFHKPTFEELEAWRNIFEDAKNDPDFKIFTHPGVEIECIEVGKIVAVE